MARGSQPTPQLYGITDARLMSGEHMLRKVEAALSGGCGWIQYRDKSRDKSADPRRRLAEAGELLQLCHAYNAKLIINDDVDLAAEVGADGVHLGQDDMPAPAARERLGTDAIIGVTCHADLNLARQAQADGASYVAFGRFFTSATKPGASAAPLDVLVKAKRELVLPVVAIGGIDLHNAASVLAAGADTIAVCGGLFAHDDPTRQARALTSPDLARR